MGAEDVPEEPRGAEDERIEQEARKGGSAEADGLKAPPFRSSDLPVQSSPSRERTWSPTDVAVVLTALALLGLSIAGLFWLLHT
jgi:hypothetical protein